MEVVHRRLRFSALLQYTNRAALSLSCAPNHYTPHNKQQSILRQSQGQQQLSSFHLGGTALKQRRPLSARPDAARPGQSWSSSQSKDIFTNAGRSRRDPQRFPHQPKPNATQSRTPAPLQFYATCHPGLEQVVAQELSSPLIGAQNVDIGKAGVSFSGPDMGVGLRANLWLRSAVRVLLLLAAGSLEGYKRGGDELYEFVRESVEWAQLLPRGRTFSVVAHLGAGNRDMSNSQFAATRVKDAVCDAMRDARGFKPDAPREEGADLPLHLTVHHDQVLLYRNMSGSSLHRRGYRDVMHRASLNEAAAAGMLLLADWPKISQQEGAVLADPMCGSGTLLIEAALMARNIAPGSFRTRWPFLTWPDTDQQLWSSCLDDAQEQVQPWQGRILGNDVHPGALSLASRDIRRAELERLIHLTNEDCRNWSPRHKPTLVVTNPPWGLRLMSDARDSGPPSGYMLRGRGMSSQGLEEPHPDAVAAWEALSVCLKEHCRDSTALVLCGNAKLTQHLKMKATCRFPVTIGGVDTRVLKYEIYPPLPAAVRAQRESTTEYIKVPFQRAGSKLQRNS